MLLILTENIFYIILIDQEVAAQDMAKGLAAFSAVYDLLLVTERDL